ncbi:MAG TPA: ABC transporter permease, partial [Chitinophagales bacterium]|nr:ABC transporter permease [Chitinophagales bacterium]
MKFTLRIAWRYIFSRKSTNAINIISGISMSGIMIGSAALIIVLSAFNGFENLVQRLYNTFYPDITVT